MIAYCDPTEQVFELWDAPGGPRLVTRTETFEFGSGGFRVTAFLGAFLRVPPRTLRRRGLIFNIIGRGGRGYCIRDSDGHYSIVRTLLDFEEDWYEA